MKSRENFRRFRANTASEIISRDSCRSRKDTLCQESLRNAPLPGKEGFGNFAVRIRKADRLAEVSRVGSGSSVSAIGHLHARGTGPYLNCYPGHAVQHRTSLQFVTPTFGNISKKAGDFSRIFRPPDQFGNPETADYRQIGP